MSRVERLVIYPLLAVAILLAANGPETAEAKPRGKDMTLRKLTVSEIDLVTKEGGGILATLSERGITFHGAIHLENADGSCRISSTRISIRRSNDAGSVGMGMDENGRGGVSASGPKGMVVLSSVGSSGGPEVRVRSKKSGVASCALKVSDMGAYLHLAGSTAQRQNQEVVVRAGLGGCDVKLKGNDGSCLLGPEGRIALYDERGYLKKDQPTGGGD